MQETDELQVEILEDGRLKITSGDLDGPNHTNAERFLAELSRLVGGDVTREKLPQAQTHTHTRSRQQTRQ